MGICNTCYDEKEFKDALMNNVQKFLLELGMGFAFVGREYRLVVGETEQFIDMLFYLYNVSLRGAALSRDVVIPQRIDAVNRLRLPRRMDAPRNDDLCKVRSLLCSIWVLTNSEKNFFHLWRARVI